MGEILSIASNGHDARGHLAIPDSGSGPGLMVIQEWWGLNPQMKGVADYLADQGFVALAPDLYHGELAGHDEMDKAGQLMTDLPADRAARDMSGAVDYLLDHSSCTGDGVGVVGFCMGGLLSFMIAANRGDAVKAAVPFYGFPQGEDQPNWDGLTASIQGHMASPDDFFPPEAAIDLGERLRAMGKDAQIEIHEAGHGFMNEENPIGTFNEGLAAELWPQVISFLQSKLG